WWPEGETDSYLTALAIDAAARAALAGIAIEAADPVLERAPMVVPRIFADARTPDGEAYVIAHLAALTRLPNSKQRFPGIGERIDEIALTLRSSPDALSNAGLALATRAHAELGMKTEAAPLLGALLARASTEGGGLHWGADPAFESDWWGEDISNTAYGLAALDAVKPDDRRAADG